MNEQPTVLVVGAGPVGLGAALLLARRGIGVQVIERNPGTSVHPKGHVANTRTMEIFRELGVASAVIDASIDIEAMRHVRWVSSLLGEQLGHLDRDRTMLDVSPEVARSCAQDRIEQILLDAGRDTGAAVDFGAELVSLTQDVDGVDATVEQAGRRSTIRAQYVLAADGAASTTRRLLDVSMIGPDHITTAVGVYFHLDLQDELAARPSVLYWALNQEAPGLFIRLDDVGRWVFHYGLVGRPSVDLSDEELLGRLRSAIGDDRPVEVRSIKPWRMTAQIAERYRVQRVFLAGDAAHRFPPTGGLGMNTGLQDAHNLAWKLALVLDGRAPDGLLDTYEGERWPIGKAVSDFSLANFTGGGAALGPGAGDTIDALARGGADAERARAAMSADIAGMRAHFGGLGRDLGFSYVAGAIIDDGSDPRPGSGEYEPDARPGSRAPHGWLADGRSTLDLWRTGFWSVERTGVGKLSMTPLDVGEPQTMRAEEASIDQWGIEVGGGVLVRPDGHVAWRSRAKGSVADATSARDQLIVV